MKRSLLHSLLTCALLIGLFAVFFVPAAIANAGTAHETSSMLLLQKVYLPLVMKPIQPPTAPGSLTATAVSTSTINLSWTDNSNNESGFQIERAPINTSSFLLVTTTAANTNTYQNSGLASGTGYAYRVRAINAAGVSAYTAVASATTLVAAPAAPTGLNASGTTATSTTLKWTDNASNETGFELERYIGGIWVKIAGTDVLGPNANQRTVTALASQTTYKFRVRAVNQGGYSAWSNEVSVTTLPAPVTIPAAPSSLTYSNLTATTVKLSWVDNANNETWFDLQESVNGGAWTTISNASNLPANYTYANITDLLPDTNHSYRIRAVNSAGSSAFSNTVSFRTPAVPQTKLRVVNNGTVDYIISLKVNNVEYLPTWDKAIAPGASRDIPLNPGSVNIVATTGWWDTQANPPARFSKYLFSFSGTIDPGTTEVITVENPTIEGLLTNFSQRRSWYGPYYPINNFGWYRFCFYDNGRWRLYDKGVQIGYGWYSMDQYGQLATYFHIDDDDGSYMDGLLDMTAGGGKFSMKNGPAGWETVMYTMESDTNTNTYCPVNPP